MTCDLFHGCYSILHRFKLGVQANIDKPGVYINSLLWILPAFDLDMYCILVHDNVPFQHYHISC